MLSNKTDESEKIKIFKTSRGGNKFDCDDCTTILQTILIRLIKINAKNKFIPLSNISETSFPNFKNFKISVFVFLPHSE